MPLRMPAWRPLLGILAAVLGTSSARGAEPVASPLQRVPWTTSRIVGSPDPPLPYVTARAFPALKFNHGLDLTSAPGSDRLFVVEQAGKVFSFPTRSEVSAADLVIDLPRHIEGVKEVYALAFHPQFEQNRYCYLCYIKAPNLDDGTHIARFEVSRTDPPTIDPSTEQTVITWLSGGHNGCCLKFGPDGYLYISTGDGTGPNPPDARRAGQDVTNLLSSILRIDVDHADAGRNYRIPPDNPFVNLPGARGEIWAYGFRNPWRMSFDRRTGDLWVGDVGWELWELLHRVERGGNYGWSIMEGRQPTNPEWARGPTAILPPTIDHPHSESSSITDGLTYYGSRLPDLHGVHIYGDYDTGKIWGFRWQNGRAVEHRELADTTHRIVGFGEDRTHELYLLDHTAGTIHILVPNPLRDQASRFPRRLTETGLFRDVAAGTPAPGVLSYTLHAEPWADYASAARLVAVPQAGSIVATGNSWTFPEGSVLVKTLSLDVEHGNSASRRRVETQILHFDGRDWQPYTYQWNDDQTDAVLVEAGGTDRTFEIADPAVPGGRRRQVWHYAGRAECQRCHNRWSGPPLGFQLALLNTPPQDRTSGVSQLDLFAQVRLIEQLPPADKRPRLVSPHDPSADLDSRARAYLHVNCAHCHRLHAGGAVLSKMTFDTPLDKTDMVGVRPTQGTFGIPAAQVIAPGDPFRSVLFYRMSKVGGGRMPHLGSTEIDRTGVELIYAWLQQMPVPAPQDAGGSPAAPHLRQVEQAHWDRLLKAASAAERDELLERLLASTSGALRLARAVDRQLLAESTQALVVERGAQHPDASIRDLFERFLPPERRVPRLGSVVRPEQLLALPGDAARGRTLFLNTSGVQCKNCHRLGPEGPQVGPELTSIGKKYTRPQLLESILEPSKFIDPKYVTYLVETRDGKLFTGLLVHKDEQSVVLKDAQNKDLRLALADVEQIVPQRQSLMPELLLRDLTAQQVADLLEFLTTLK